MNIGIIQNGICINAVAFNNLTTAKQFLTLGAFPGADMISELPIGFGIGDFYENNTWKKSPIPDMTKEELSNYKNNAIVQTKYWIEQTLEKPMEYKGKLYSVTLEKQNLLSAQLGMYLMNTQFGHDYPLTWNATGEPCEPWEFANLLALSNAIAEYVGEIVKKQQMAEIAINEAITRSEVDEILQEFL